MQPDSCCLCLGLNLYGQGDDLVKGLRMKVTGQAVLSMYVVSLGWHLLNQEVLPAAFVKPGEFSPLGGFSHLESRSRIYFSLSGSGKALLSIGEEEVLSVEGEDFLQLNLNAYV